MDIWWWLNFVMPDDSNDLWTAVGALATVAVGFLVHRISWRQLYLESTPVLLAHRAGRRTTLRNSGKSLALNVVSVDSQGDARPVAPSLEPGGEVELTHARLTVTESNYVYYQGILGQWFSTKLIGISFTGEEAQFRVESTVSSITHRKLPASVRSQLKRSSRSAADHLAAISSVMTAEGWRFRIGNAWKAARLWAGPVWWGIGETKRVQTYLPYAAEGAVVQPTDEERAKWDVELAGILTCWHTTGRRVLHLSNVSPEEGGLVCRVVLRSAFDGSDTPGLVAISPSTWVRLMPLPRSIRNDYVWERFTDYVCGLRPKKFFVCKL